MGVREEAAHDRAAIRLLEELAFGRAAEADLVDRLRASGTVVLSLVMEDGGQPQGHILFSRLKLPGVKAVALAPMAVHPAMQRRGIGSAMVRAGLDILSQRGEQAVFVVGHPGYYPRFGFRNDLAAQFDSPYAGEAFFALELQPDALRDKAGPVLFDAEFEGLE
jgi:putative acetyltransferase